MRQLLKSFNLGMQLRDYAIGLELWNQTISNFGDKYEKGVPELQERNSKESPN